MYLLRTADVGDGGDDLAPDQVAADDMVLGRPLDGDPLQRHVGTTVDGELGLGSYKTAWLLAQKLRRAMVDPNRDPLEGVVEVDQTEMPFRADDNPDTRSRPARSSSSVPSK